MRQRLVLASAVVGDALLGAGASRGALRPAMLPSLAHCSSGTSIAAFLQCQMPAYAGDPVGHEVTLCIRSFDCAAADGHSA
jgi:hypothetical protein